MKKENLFEIASRKKYRFTSTVGALTVETLWDLPLEAPTNKPDAPNLNDIAVNISKQLKESGEENFVGKKTTLNKELESKLDLVKHIIEVKLDEIQEKVDESERKAEHQKVLAAIEAKEESDLHSKSLPELKKLEKKLRA